ncbi:hypothetical protein GCM10025738_18200 [Microbacterium fluvii]
MNSCPTFCSSDRPAIGSGVGEGPRAAGSDGAADECTASGEDVGAGAATHPDMPNVIAARAASTTDRKRIVPLCPLTLDAPRAMAEHRAAALRWINRSVKETP